MNSPENSVKNFLNKAMLKNEQVRDAATLAVIAGFSYGLVRPFEQGQFDIVPPVVFQGHLHDLIGPFAHAYANRVMLGRNLLLNSMAAFVAPTLVEAHQGISGNGTFDSKDFIAYGIGTALYVGMEKYLNRNATKMEADQEYNVNINPS